MRATLLLLFTLQLAAGLYANDTLTRAQVYNFSVGDTFDYKSEGGNSCYPMWSSSTTYTRYVIKDVYYSTNNDTLFVVRERQYPAPVIIETLVIDSPNRYEIMADYSGYFNMNYLADSTLKLRLDSFCVPTAFNTVAGTTLGRSFSFQYGNGLGITCTYESSGEGNCGSTATERMIYYSKGSERCGTPYYELNGAALLHFTPIPEECAVWSSQVSYIKEQISTGARIDYQGHTFVEMIYRAIDTLHNTYIADSLIGYFRNDTVNEKTLFYKAVDIPPFFEYDYRMVQENSYCRAIDQILVNGQLRTRWQYDRFNDYRAYDYPKLWYAEGIGGLNGLIPVQMAYIVGFPYNIADFAELTSFCVCGQAIYPNSSASCALLSGVNEVARQYPIFTLSPNPAGSSVVITLGENTTAQTLSITDITGRTVVSFQLPSSTYTLSTETLPEGIYFATISNGVQSAANKLVIAR
ncbi:MAG TPA: T9SS type A sorting domain-containing protein [Chitinophagales bacterium]|nr:T9SS type A sorting domain-containing protein [Chitinophagales bacterium]